MESFHFSFIRDVLLLEKELTVLRSVLVLQIVEECERGWTFMNDCINADHGTLSWPKMTIDNLTD
jgi:hypothetical protein